jgi:hypothetical protein
MRRIPRHILPSTPQCRFFVTSNYLCQSIGPIPPSPEHKHSHDASQDNLNSRSHAKLKEHPQAPTPTRGFGPFTRNTETGKRLTFLEREEEKAKEYLYSQPDPNLPLPPLLLLPPGLAEPPEQGIGHGKEIRSWWQREFEIWFGRYQKPFDVQSQVERHRTMYFAKSFPSD